LLCLGASLAIVVDLIRVPLGMVIVTAFFGVLFLYVSVVFYMGWDEY
jgi:hypothetical protein